MSDSGVVTQLLIFSVGGHTAALTASAVLEVVRAVAVTPLPRAPRIVEGVINLRGRVVPVLDLGRRMRFGMGPLHPDQHMILAEAGARCVALRVDRALDVVSVAAEAIEAAARSTPGVEHVAGIAKLPDGLLVIHDIETFLSLDEAAELDAAVTGAS